MSNLRGQILEPDKAFQLSCHKCGKALFAVVVAGDGVTCRCASCHQPYKIESPGGVVITNA